MASVESNLRTYLIGKAGITAIFGASNTRIYVNRVHASITTAYPYAILRRVLGAPPYAHDGALPETSLTQIDVYSDSATTVDTGSAAIRTELSGLTGTVSGLTVGHTFITDQREDFDPESRTFRNSTDYEIGQNG